jgi:hypothetical protein
MPKDVDEVTARFWAPLSSAVAFGDAGFMHDPAGKWSSAFVPDAVGFDAIASKRGLILIGEPGLGKTTALQREADRVAARVRGDGHVEQPLDTCEQVSFVDLGSTADEERLHRKIFESDAFTSWRAGEGVLHLFLDALDESLVLIERVADLLTDGLHDVPWDRLFLRITCRTAERHLGLEASLRNALGDDAFGVYELLPLRRRDVLAAAESCDLDADAFLREVIDRELQPLAMKPMTLRMLLASATEQMALPDNRVELYGQGSLLLCAEPDEDRRRGSTAGRLSATERLAVARRIAAVSVLCGRGRLPIHDQPGNTDEIAVTELVGGTEPDTGPALESRVGVDTAAVKEALRTGLFSARGAGMLGFAHQSLAEFLCAQFLAIGRLAEEQIADLLLQETDRGRRVIPQLRETASWLAALSPRFLKRLLDSDPVVALRSDLAATDAEDRARLVDTLLSAAGRYEVDPFDTRLRDRLPQLRHPGLADQLRKALNDREASAHVREFALAIAKACAVTELEDELVALALDRTSEIWVRAAAVSALERSCSDGNRRRLVPLAVDGADVDEDDALKAAVLRVCWPQVMTIEQLTAALTEPKDEWLVGWYSVFLSRDAVLGMRDDQLPHALRWAATLPISHFPAAALDGVREQLLVRAAALLSLPDVADAYATLIGSLVKHSTWLLSDPTRRDHPDLLASAERRRPIVHRLVPALASGDLNEAEVVFCRPPVVYADDLDWLVDNLDATIGSPLEVGWARLVAAMHARGAADLQAVYEARERSPELRNLTATAFDAVAINSPEANQARARRCDLAEIEEKHKRLAKPRPNIPAEVAQALDRFDAGESNGFWHAICWLEIDSSGRRREQHVSDIRRLTGWQLLDESAQARVAAASSRYLRELEIDATRFVGREVIHYPATAAYRALRLLAETDEPRLQALSGVWQRCASVIVESSWGETSERDVAFSEWAVLQAIHGAPEETAHWLGVRLDRELRQDSCFVLHRFRQVRHPVVEQVVLSRARRSRLAPALRAQLIDFLLDTGSFRGRRLAERVVSRAALQAGGPRRELAVRVGALLTARSTDASWTRLWPLFQIDKEFGLALVARLAGDRDDGITSRLTEAQAGALFEWLENQWPHRDEPGLPVPARQSIGDWRDGIVMRLAARGTADAVKELDRLAAVFPDLLWLRPRRHHAAELVQRHAWLAPSPADVLRLAEAHERRWIRSDADLLDAVVESLIRAERELQGQPPAAQQLWDAKLVQPKPENELSDWLALFLRRDLIGGGVVVGRELQVRSRAGGRMGDQPDLTIDAVAKAGAAPRARFSLRVEVKGCWHRDVDTAMSAQLVDRYLDAGHPAGLYIVGYFEADEWGGSAGRARCRRRPLSAWRAVFDAQAAGITGLGQYEVRAVVLDCSLPPRKGSSRRV